MEQSFAINKHDKSMFPDELYYIQQVQTLSGGWGWGWDKSMFPDELYCIQQVQTLSHFVCRCIAPVTSSLHPTRP